jgi:hypothetical protein
VNDHQLLLALLVGRLGGRQVVTDLEFAEARHLRLESCRAGDSLVLEAIAEPTPPLPNPPLFHLEGEA